MNPPPLFKILFFLIALPVLVVVLLVLVPFLLLFLLAYTLIGGKRFSFLNFRPIFHKTQERTHAPARDQSDDVCDVECEVLHSSTVDQDGNEIHTK